MTVTPRLADALDRIHDLFGGLTAAPGETGCTYCYGEQDIALLHRPDVPLPDDLLCSFLHEVPDHFDDHPAVIRRLLPQFCTWLAAGSFEGIGYASCGLGRSGWPGWPGPQAAAVREFIDAWWDDFLRRDSSPYDITDVFAYCADLGGTVTPLLARWADEPVGGPGDQELAHACEAWEQDLLGDDAGGVVPWWYWFDRDEPVREVQLWLAGHAPPRLRAAGADPDLVTRIELLALPYDDRWAHPYWDAADSSASAAETN
ncbi:hypothetical protein OG453_17145 [Streptomyces sp. NBC_01381]|uniref:hypothetical protein n=1 Tax=Streptomyces sp. NBC_01381 TaxID=2903845 RepID=UPI002256AA1F|nr:hypothetical protein [Streptomyces sp. NBC_01381]MCX4668381.1 hypothetical protein [Streptomyces sp. NBC_01381]